MSELWIIWGAGFITGAMAAYLGCTLFCRRILKEEGEIVAFLNRKRDRELNDSALNSFLKEWERQMDLRASK